MSGGRCHSDSYMPATATAAPAGATAAPPDTLYDTIMLDYILKVQLMKSREYFAENLTWCIPLKDALIRCRLLSHEQATTIDQQEGDVTKARSLMHIVCTAERCMIRPFIHAVIDSNSHPHVANELLDIYDKCTRETYDDLLKEQNKKKKELEERIKKLQSEQDKSSERIQELQAKLHQLNDEKEELQGKHSKIQRECRDLHSKVKQMAASENPKPPAPPRGATQKVPSDREQLYERQLANVKEQGRLDLEIHEIENDIKERKRTIAVDEHCSKRMQTDQIKRRLSESEKRLKELKDDKVKVEESINEIEKKLYNTP